MILFPEIFSNRLDKFNRLSVWLVNSEGIVCPNIRDVFTSGGRRRIEFYKKQIIEVPQIIVKLSNSIKELNDLLNNTDIETLEKYWERPVKNKKKEWIELIKENTTNYRAINLAEYLKENLS